jgi:ferrochelatase
MKFLAPAEHAHDAIDRTAVLLINLGTPRAPTSAAVRRYLNEFLLDPRVVEIPRPIWWLILRAIILPLRSSASAGRYASVWTEDGSPLLANSELQQRALAAQMQARGYDVDVELAMRYGDPSIPAVLERLRTARTRRLLVLPMYPQYSATTTGSAFDGVAAVLQRSRNLPELRWIRGFHDDPGYIRALAASVRAYWDANGRPDRLVMSFHGLPRRNLDIGDPYHCECHKTGRLLAEALGLPKEAYVVTFQSRFGRARWLEPYTADTLRTLARSGVGRVDVVCPGFPADCLETLEEIGLEARADFLSSGGKSFHLIPCLNGDATFAGALADLLERHLQGWPARVQDVQREREDAPRVLERARALGATR